MNFIDKSAEELKALIPILMEEVAIRSTRLGSRLKETIRLITAPIC